jgi:excisionase family DNA binding protein
MERFINGYRELSEASNVPVRTLRSLVRNGVLPFIKAGHRTILFSPSKVEKALQRRSIKAAGA